MIANEKLEILTYTDDIKLRDVLLQFMKFGYKLVGPVQVGVNQNNRMVYVATVIKEDA